MIKCRNESSTPERMQQEARKSILLEELKVCSSTGNVQRGRQIHQEGIASGHCLCIYFATALVNMYAKCKSMSQAREVFDSINEPNVVSWTALILGYADNGEGFAALELFADMKVRSCTPNSFTFVAVLKACTSLAADGRTAQCLEWGKKIHSEIGCHLNLKVQNSLIDMYAKCGSLIEARQVFDTMEYQDVVSWNALLFGYADNGESRSALDLFARMNVRGCAFNYVTFFAVLKACTALAVNRNSRADVLERGREIHRQIGCHLTMKVQNALIDMYSNCGSMEDALQTFQDMKRPDVVSWNTLMLGYADNGEGAKALNLFARMKSQRCIPNSFTFVAALKACGTLAVLEAGRRIHQEVADTGNLILVNSLVDFYAKCGSLVDAQAVFDSHPGTRDLISWNALLAGYSRSGDRKAVFELFERMHGEGFQPDGVTFLSILTCCSHAGDEKASEFFELMTSKYGITPTIEHCNCMVNILGRSKKLDSAVALLRSLPCCCPDAFTWMIILCACRKWKNVGIGRLAFESLLGLNDGNAAAYVLMADTYRSRGMRKEQQMMLAMRKELKHRQEEPGQTCWTNEDGEVHAFVHFIEIRA